MSDQHQAGEERSHVAAVRHAREALTSIQTHGALSDNELSMIWTARVALDPDALSICPPHLVDAVRERFSDLDARYNDEALVPAQLAHSERERAERAEAALRELLAAAAPYHDNAAPHEELFSAEDYRNFERLSPALEQARAVLNPNQGGTDGE